MNEVMLLVRIHDRPGAMERVCGLLRRRAFVVTRFSLARSTPGRLELVVRVDGTATDARRVERELVSVHDVVTIRVVDPAAIGTREFLRARVQADAVPPGPGEVRDGVYEVVGSPSEIDKILDGLRAREALHAYVRSGELALPDGPHDPSR